MWLPAGIVASSVIRGLGLPADPQAWQSLAVVAPAGLPLALPCRWLYRRGFRVAAGVSAGILVPVTVVAALGAGLFGPLAIAVSAVLNSLPAWVAVLLRR